MSTPEGKVLKSCMEYLTLCGIFHFRNNTGGTPLHDGSGRYRPAPKSSVGSPDIICVARDQAGHGGWAVAVEVKSATGKQSPSQKEFQQKWEDAGGLYVVVRSASELREELGRYGVKIV